MDHDDDRMTTERALAGILAGRELLSRVAADLARLADEIERAGDDLGAVEALSSTGEAAIAQALYDAFSMVLVGADSLRSG